MIKVLLKNDLKALKTDYMMWLVFLVPILCASLYQLVIVKIDFLTPYLNVFGYLFISLTGMMVGGVIGLRILDEKDQQLLKFYSVTPLTLKGYFMYRSVLCALISVISCLIIFCFVIGKINASLMVLETLLGVVCMYLIGGIAKNKIQGTIMLKPMGIVIVIPCMRLLGENVLEGAIGILPWDYAYQVLVEGQGNLILYCIYIILIIGFLVSFMNTRVE